MPYCPIHQKITHRKCRECGDHEDRSERAKRSYTEQNPYGRSTKGIDIPDYGQIMTLEELKEIPIEEWTEEHWMAKRLRIAERNHANTYQD